MKKSTIGLTNLKRLRPLKGGDCSDTDGAQKDQIILSAVFDDDKILHFKKHALKHIDTLNLSCKNPVEPIKHLILRALYNGRVKDGRKSLDILNSYEGRGALTFVGKRSNGEHYCITGTWDYLRKILTIFQMCKCDANGCLY
jgi:hypothetical protein